jgi:serine-type D-Ala-D-Ala carboxypeptidase (penicillin-binding protein 5/6)
MNNKKQKLAKKAKAAILTHKGNILFSKNADKQLPVASLTKILTTLIALEEIDKGTLKWDDWVKISSAAVKTRGSKVGLMTGQKLSVKDTVKGVIIASGNDTAIALAEHISGSVRRFVKRMNKKAAQLGLHHFTFVDPHGLSAKNCSTAYDIAKLSMLLIKRKEILNISKLQYDHIRTSDRQLIKLKNTNQLIGKVPEVDGLKTGNTHAAGYCLSATAKKDHQRVVAIVLGTPSGTDRVNECHEMIDYAFSTSRGSH